MKMLLATITALFLTATIPVLGLPMLIIIFFYVLATSNLPPYTSLAQYGLMSFSSHSENSVTEARIKGYHDYQIEAFLSRKRQDKVSEIENVGLSAVEEEEFEEIVRGFKNSNES
jgi:hypothetical protein